MIISAQNWGIDLIVDTLDNIDHYKSLSAEIYSGLKFIAEAKPSISLGTYVVDKNVTAIVSEYNTVACFERGYEAHRCVIDIQYPIYGIERVKWSPLTGMKINIPYDKEKDRTFYTNPSGQGLNVDIGNGVFAIMFPKDAHSPQHFLDQSELIKKITIKVNIN